MLSDVWRVMTLGLACTWIKSPVVYTDAPANLYGSEISTRVRKFQVIRPYRNLRPSFVTSEKNRRCYRPWCDAWRVRIRQAKFVRRTSASFFEWKWRPNLPSEFTCPLFNHSERNKKHFEHVTKLKKRVSSTVLVNPGQAKGLHLTLRNSCLFKPFRWP